VKPLRNQKLKKRGMTCSRALQAHCRGRTLPQGELQLPELSILLQPDPAQSLMIMSGGTPSTRCCGTHGTCRTCPLYLGTQFTTLADTPKQLLSRRWLWSWLDALEDAAERLGKRGPQACCPRPLPSLDMAIKGYGLATHSASQSTTPTPLHIADSE